MKYVSGFIWKLGINFSVFIKWIDETWLNNRLLLVPNCYEVVAMVATMITIVMSYIEINKAVSQWLLTFNLCVSVTWPLTCAFHIPCTHTPEIIDVHRGMCDNHFNACMLWIPYIQKLFSRAVFKTKHGKGNSMLEPRLFIIAFSPLNWIKLKSLTNIAMYWTMLQQH